MQRLHVTMYSFIFIVTFLGTSVADLSGECDMVGFYQELGCTALVSSDNSSNCPEAFSCPDLHPDPKMCFYRGSPYVDRAMIPQRLVNNPCSQACRCSVSGVPQFDCAAVDCVETFDSDMQENCINTYDLESCCSTGTVCGKDAVAKLNTCEVDGKTYMEGQSFEPANTRKTCICTAQWNGSFDDSTSCRDINCGLEIHYQDKIFDNCAPVFSGNMKSCPIDFQCLSNSTKLIRGLNLRSVGSQCLFGNMTMSVGDEVVVDEKCTKCACDVPPFVSCTKKSSCDE